METSDKFLQVIDKKMRKKYFSLKLTKNKWDCVPKGKVGV